MRQMIEVDVPDGWEAVGFCVPQVGDHYVLDDGTVILCRVNFTVARLIVRKVWSWPEWLTANFLTCDADGTWIAHVGVPEICVDTNGWTSAMQMIISKDFLDFAHPPKVGGWHNHIFCRSEWE